MIRVADCYTDKEIKSIQKKATAGWKALHTCTGGRRSDITCTYTNSNESNDSRHACCVSNDVYTELSDSLYGPGHPAYLK